MVNAMNAAIGMKGMNTIEKALTVTELSKRTGISIYTIRKALEKGELNSFELGGRLLIPASEYKRLRRMNTTTEQTVHEE